MLVIINIFILKLEKLRFREIDCLCKVIHVCEAAGPGLDFDYKSHIMFPLARGNWACIRSLDLHSSIQSPNCVQLFLTPWTTAHQATLSITNSWSPPKLTSIESVMPSFSCPQSLPASESFPMSQLFKWGGQSTGVSALASFLPKNTQD